MSDPTILSSSLQANQTTSYSESVVNSAIYGSPALNNTPTQPIIPPYLANISPTNVNPVTTSTNSTNTNVILDYDWTYSEDQMIKSTVPYIKLYEKKLMGSAIVNNLIYGLLATPDVLEAGRSNISTIAGATGITGAASSLANSLGIPALIDKITSAAGATTLGSMTTTGINTFVTGMVAKLQSYRNNMSSLYNPIAGGSVNQPGYVDMYNYLYMAQNMYHTYIFPYLDNSFYSANNDFSVRPFKENNAVSKFVSRTISNIEDFAESVLDLMEPGVYIEKSQFYNFDSPEKPITVMFHLLNTKNVASIIANYKLINRLITNNKPFRQNRVLVDPPFIYEVEIPGVAYYPYAYLRNITVDFVGTRRIVKVENNNCIVPDAYTISISIQPLTTQAANYILAETGSDLSQFAARTSGIAAAANIISTVANIITPITPTPGPTVVTNGNVSTPSIPATLNTNVIQTTNPSGQIPGFAPTPSNAYSLNRI